MSSKNVNEINVVLSTIYSCQSFLWFVATISRSVTSSLHNNKVVLAYICTYKYKYICIYTRYKYTILKLQDTVHNMSLMRVNKPFSYLIIISWLHLKSVTCLYFGAFDFVFFFAR